VCVSDRRPAHRCLACIEALRDGPFALWVGFGARDAPRGGRGVRAADAAPVLCSPRAKGIFPEDDPLFVGVTGLAGHASVFRYLEEHAPRRILVLGSRLGEATSFWDPRSCGPAASSTWTSIRRAREPPTPCAHARDGGDVGATLDALLACAVAGTREAVELPRPTITPLAGARTDPVRPER
jgi:acetolactate synthase-1/2/3 large subunit